MTADGSPTYVMGYDHMTCLFCGRVVSVGWTATKYGPARWDISRMVRHIQQEHWRTVRVLP